MASDYQELKVQLDLSELAPAPNFRASWNIAPTQELGTVILDPQVKGRALRMMKWGLIPSWSKEPKMLGATFNARAETVEEKPSFRGAWRAGRRCLLVVDGFYEWRKSDKKPFTIARAGGGLLAMAGLWELWRSQSGPETVVSCTVLTTVANDAMADLHDRMPVILSPEDWPVWLGEQPADPEALRALLSPCPSAELSIWEVDKAVGNVRNDGPHLAEKVAARLI
jgi:putative SOS response-associated peptidase YedK